MGQFMNVRNVTHMNACEEDCRNKIKNAKKYNVSK
jgi:hypothetical protein